MASDADKFKEKPFFLTWWFEWLILAACLLGGWGLWQLVDHSLLFAFQDDPRYLRLAMEVLNGRWDALFQNTHFNIPPLYPALLAGILATLGNPADMALQALVSPAKEINFAFYLLSIVLVYQFLDKRIRKPYSFIIAVLYALSPLTVMAAGSISPDMTYVVLSLMALVTFDRMLSEKGLAVTRWDMALAGFWLIAAIFTRHEGLTLLLAFFLVAWYRLGTRRSFVILGTFLAILAPWYLGEIFHRTFYDTTQPTVAAQEIRPAFQDSFLGHSLARFQLQGALKSPLDDPAHFTDNLLDNADETLKLVTRSTLGILNLGDLQTLVQRTPLQPTVLDFGSMLWVRWVVGLFIALGMLYGFYQFSGLPGMYLLVVLGMQWLFPGPEGISVLPILPFLLYFLFLGVMRLGEVLKQIHLPVSKVLAPTLTVLIGLSSLNGHLAHIRETREGYLTLAADDSGLQQHAQPPSRTARERAAHWLATHTGADAQVVSTGSHWPGLVPTRRIRPLTDARKALQADYIVEDQAAAQANQALFAPVLNRYQDRFRLVYNDPAGGIRIWQVQPGPHRL